MRIYVESESINGTQLDDTDNRFFFRKWYIIYFTHIISPDVVKEWQVWAYMCTRKVVVFAIGDIDGSVQDGGISSAILAEPVLKTPRVFVFCLFVFIMMIHDFACLIKWQNRKRPRTQDTPDDRVFLWYKITCRFTNQVTLVL